MSSRTIAELVARGDLVRVTRGTYRRPGTELSPALQAAALAHTHRAVLSHATALEWWGFSDVRGPFELTVPRARRVRHSDATFHHHDLPAAAVTTLRGVRVTTPVETTVSLARVSVRRGVEAGDFFCRSDLTDVTELRRALRAASGPRSVGPHLAEVLVSPLSGSSLESRAMVLWWASRVPLPARQVEIVDREGVVGRFDFVWLAERVVVEVDGFEWHSSIEAFKRDRRRWSRLAAAGWTVLVLTWDDIVNRPAQTAELVRRALAGRRARVGA